jgi:nitrogen fixation protein FixH
MTGRDGAIERGFTGRHLLLLMVGFFGVVIAVNALMAALASRSWTGLAVKNAYVASQHYNEVLDEARLQSERGWSASVKVFEGLPVLSLRDRNGNPVSGLAVSARFERATHEGEDATVGMRERGAGVYVSDRRLEPGLWLARVETDAPRFRQEFRLVVKREP